MAPFNQFAKSSGMQGSDLFSNSRAPLSQDGFSSSPLKQVHTVRSSSTFGLKRSSDAGNSFRKARNLGTFDPGEVEIRNGRTDEDDPDYFKFKFDVNGRGRIQVRIRNNSLNGTELDVFLYNKSRKRLTRKTGIEGLDTGRLNYTKARRGIYYLKVIGDDNRTTRYTLSFYFRD